MQNQASLVLDSIFSLLIILLFISNGYVDGLIAGLGLTILGNLPLLPSLLLLLHLLNEAATEKESHLKGKFIYK